MAVHTKDVYVFQVKNAPTCGKKEILDMKNFQDSPSPLSCDSQVQYIETI